MSASSAVGRPETDRWAPAGRPVLTFLSAGLLLLILSTAAWWAGLASPRLDVTSGGASSAVDDTGAGTASIRVTNQASLPARVSGVELEGGQGVEVRFLDVGPGGTATQEAGGGGSDFTLDGGESADIELSFRSVRCRPGDAGAVTAEVKAPLGRRKPITLEAGDDRLPLIPCQTP